MNILHVASFVGNIGDNASHIGLYNILHKYLNEYTIEQLEIRKFYKNYKYGLVNKFDKSFIDYANKFDLLIFGGGGFLDYWVPGSATGTTLDIEPDLIAKIKVKTIITSMGSFPHKEIPKGNLDKFRRFLDAIFSKSNISIALRNDGSIKSLRRDIGENYSKSVVEILDNGFFYDVNSRSNFPIVSDYVAINITSDQIRMKSHLRDQIDTEEYYKELAGIIRYIIEVKSKRVVLVPHIHSDLLAISKLLECIDDYLVRNYIAIAPCVQGDSGANYNFTIYKNSHTVLATRLHANICSMTMGKRVIGLSALDRVMYLHKSLKSSDCLSIKPGFSEKVLNLLAKQGDVDAISSEIKDKKLLSLSFYETQFGSI